MKTRYIVIGAVIFLLIGIAITILSVETIPSVPQRITFDDASIFNSTKDISDIPEFEIIDVTPEMWDENQKMEEERNAIRLEQLEKLNNDPDFVKATKIIQGINSTNIEDDDYWQTVLDSLIIVNGKQGISLNDTLSFEDSEILRELIRQNHSPLIPQSTSLDYYESMNATLWIYPEVRDFHQKYENVTFVKGYTKNYGFGPTTPNFMYVSNVEVQQLGRFGIETLHKVELAVLFYENRTGFSIREYVFID